MISITKTGEIFLRIMRISFYQLVLAILCTTLVSAREGSGQDLLDRRISMSADNERVESVVRRIGKLADVRFVYSPQLIQSDRKVTLSVQNEALANVLTSLLRPLQLTYEVAGSQIILRSGLIHSALMPAALPVIQWSMPQDITITGTVTDDRNNGLPGVNILVKNTTRGVTTDANGRYTISIPDRNTVLVFSYVSFERQEVTVGNQTTVNVQLKPDTKSLNEVVVVGYGTQSRATLTGSVATIASKTFEDRGVVENPLSALQGQVPGVIVTRSSAAPGRASWNFQIRGATSTNGTQPLVIVDGTPLSDNAALNSINPNDIDNMSFLKDASAAIYGARAAGGVVLITTKRAKSGKAVIQYDASVSQKNVGLQPQLLNVTQFGTYMNQALVNDFYGTAPTSNLWYRLGLLMQNPPASRYIDLTTYNGQPVPPASNPLNPGFGDVKDLTFFDNSWVDILWGKATSTQHNLSVSGRNEKAGYRLSFGYLNDGSLLKWGNNSNSRYNIRLSHDYAVTSKLQLETNVSLEKNDIIQPTLIGNVMGQYMQPGFPTATVDGKPYSWGTQFSPQWQAALGGDDKEYNTRVFTNLRATYAFHKDLKLVAQGGYNWTATDIKTQQKAISWYNYLGTIQAPDNPTRQNSYYQRRLNKDAYFNLNAYLEYKKTLAELHDIGVTAGTQYERDEYNYYLAKTTYLANDNVPSLNLGIGDNTTKTVNEGQNHFAIGSYFGRLNYAFNQKYLFEVNARYDGSSKFNEANRWRLFYGASGGWRISQEAFMQNIPLVNELKLRASWGAVGNQSGIGLYDYIQLLNVSATGGPTSAGFPIIGSSPVVYVGPTGSLVSLDRTWERVETSNLALDFSILDRRLSGTVEYFIKHNRNMLLGQTNPAVLGAAAPSSNIGHLKTWGWELSLNWQDKIGGLTYRIGGSLTDNQNRLIDYGGANVINAGYNGAVQGYAIGSYFGLKYGGRLQTDEQVAAYRNLANGNNVSMPVTTYNADGSIRVPGIRKGDNRFVDVNGDGKLTAPGDLIYLGRDDPRYSFAMNFGLEWKGFDFSAIFQGVGQRTIFREGNWRVPFGSIFQGQSNFWIGKTWTPENTSARYPNLSAGQNATTYNTYNYQISDWSVENGAYVRLKNLVVGYTLPATVVPKIGMQKLRVYFSGNDLWELSHIRDGWDPEATRSVGRANSETTLTRYPFYRYLSFGINATF